jgi:hypothetical protein
MHVVFVVYCDRPIVVVGGELRTRHQKRFAPSAMKRDVAAFICTLKDACVELILDIRAAPVSCKKASPKPGLPPT